MGTSINVQDESCEGDNNGFITIDNVDGGAGVLDLFLNGRLQVIMS